jgi:hypothetical protein
MAPYTATKTFELFQNYRTQTKGLPSNQIKRKFLPVLLCFLEEYAIKPTYFVWFPSPSFFS